VIAMPTVSDIRIQLQIQLKRRAAWLASRVGHRLTRPAHRRFLCDRIVPALMDERTLPRKVVEVPLRKIPIRVPCDPYVYVHRNTYWCGIFFEEELESFLLREVRPGDTFIDIGMNVGHVALPAAYLVGAAGAVHAFEPQPDLARLVGELARQQGLTALHIHNCGLGDQDGELTLRIDPGHLGGATFRSDAAGEAGRVELRVPVRRGDDLLGSARFGGRVFMKIDAEGYELPVLRGLPDTLKKVDAAIIELSPEWLGSAGVEELYALMSAAGLRGHHLLPDGRRGAPLVVRDAGTEQQNVLFLR
jgi:FkbM family methyltransferase